jgi:8-oxo-dGTP pyrophosphatase MutT (NUDIX family)
MTQWLDDYEPAGQAEAADLDRVRQLVATEPAAWARDTPLHLTASALIVDPASGKVLLRWHQRQGKWLQVGGHGEAGESDPLAIALREAQEETGLPDLAPWPDALLRHVVICDVAPGKGEPAHQHADLRYLLATRQPGSIRPESPDAPLRWLTFAQARELVGTNNITVTLERAEQVLASRR